MKKILLSIFITILSVFLAGCGCVRSNYRNTTENSISEASAYKKQTSCNDAVSNTESNTYPEGSKTDTPSSSTSVESKSDSSSKAESSKNDNKTSSNSSAPGASQSGTSKVWHEAVYETVNHPAETKKVWVVDKVAYTYEEPVYETQGRIICNNKNCNGLDITDFNDEHGKAHALAGEPSNYHVEARQVQVGTKTVEVPEQGHYETKVIKEAWTEKVLVKEAGYY